MPDILRGLILILLLAQFGYTLYVHKLKINVYWCAYYVFVVFFVLPDLVFLINGVLQLKSYGYQFIANDPVVDWIYLVFAAVVCNVFRSIAIKRTRENLIELRGFRIQVSKVVWYICFGMTLIPTVAALFAPQPELYFLSFLPFYRSDVYQVSAEARQWHTSVMSNLLIVAFLGLLICWLVTAQEKKKKGIDPIRVYLAIVAVQILLFSNKRTFGILVILAMVLVDLIYKEKTPWLELIGCGSFCVAYFIFYQVITGKTVGGGQSGAAEVYAMYFSRVLDFKFVIYSLLHPDTIQILEYPGQSLLFDVLFFVPRAIWSNKPYPFGVYYTAAWNNQAVVGVTSKYLTSWFAEAVANLSWIGFPVGVWLYVKAMDIISKFKNPIVSIFALYTSIYFMVTQVGSNHENIVVLILLWFVLECEWFQKRIAPYKEYCARLYNKAMGKLKILFKNPYRIFTGLAGRGLLKWIPDDLYLKLVFRARLGQKLNLDDPQSFSEKLQWLKLHDRNPVYTEYVDKYEVRKHIANTIGEQYLIPLVGGPWDSFDEIDFDKLPNQFVLKCTHDSGGLVICKDKSALDLAAAKAKIQRCLENNYYYNSREWPYKNVKPRIIAEAYMEDDRTGDLQDYKLMCFGGEVKCSFVCSDRFSPEGLHVTFFDRDWNVMPFERKYPARKEGLPKPLNYELMVSLAQSLSKDIPFVRVDFYEINGRVYFGELTLFPGSGMEDFRPVEWDYKLGEWIDLSQVQNKN